MSFILDDDDTLEPSLNKRDLDAILANHCGRQECDTYITGQPPQQTWTCKSCGRSGYITSQRPKIP